MSEMTPVASLEAEHRLIQRLAAGMTALADRLEAGGSADAVLLERIVEFLRVFADRRHHGKEEALLFPALERHGVPAQGGPLGVMTMEHQRGRAMVGELAQAVQNHARGQARAQEALISGLRALPAFYMQHIWKEDHVLFPMAGRVLPVEEQRELVEKFRQVERETGDDAPERFEALASELEQEARAAGTG